MFLSLREGPFLQEFEPDFFVCDQAVHCESAVVALRRRFIGRLILALELAPPNRNGRSASAASHSGPTSSVTSPPTEN